VEEGRRKRMSTRGREGGREGGRAYLGQAAAMHVADNRGVTTNDIRDKTSGAGENVGVQGREGGKDVDQGVREGGGAEVGAPLGGALEEGRGGRQGGREGGRGGCESGGV